MKPKYYIATLFVLAAFFVCALFFQGCTKEDNTDCGIAVSFFYEKNVDFTNKFGSSVTHVELFLFDSNGGYMETHTGRASQIPGGGVYLPDDYVMNLTRIKPGDYTLVAWGNRSNSLRHTPLTLTKAPSSVDNSVLTLDVDGFGRAPRENFSLFHGYIQKIHVEKGFQGTKKVAMELIKFTNYIEVTKIGLAVGDENRYDCYITSKNGSYFFNGNYANDNVVTYNAYPVEVSRTDTTITSHYYILRELNSKITDSKLVLTYLKDDGTTETLASLDLAEEMINCQNNPPFFVNPRNPKNTGDLDRDDEYYIEIRFIYTHGTITIWIKNWSISLPYKPKIL